MEVITSRQNAIVKEIRALKKRAARDKLGLAFVEGKRLVDEALGAASGAEAVVRTLCVSEGYARSGGFDVLKQASAAGGYKLVVLADHVFGSVSETMQPQGLLAVIEMRAYAIGDLMGGKGRPGRILMLDRVRDPGNAGSMFRTAEAAGFTGVAMSDGTVDIYEPKTLRATMGAAFRVPFLRGADLFETVGRLRQAGYCIYASAAQGGGADCFSAPPARGDIALIIGGEAHGIDRRLLDMCDATLSIPMCGKAESLNAGVAAGILMYEFARRGMAEQKQINN